MDVCSLSNIQHLFLYEKGKIKSNRIHLVSKWYKSQTLICVLTKMTSTIDIWTAGISIKLVVSSSVRCPLYCVLYIVEMTNNNSHYSQPSAQPQWKIGFLWDKFLGFLWLCCTLVNMISDHTHGWMGIWKEFRRSWSQAAV